MDIVFQSLLSSTTSISFYKVEAEVQGDLSAKFGVTVVPTFILLNEDNSIQNKVEGTDAASLTQAVSALLNTSSTEGSEETLNKRIKTLLSSSKVMLFMKGNPTSPRCGFSRQIVELLQNHKITFDTFDILEDEEIRQGLKTYSDWPTYPQLYVNGELIGGLDIIKEMAEEGNLAESLGIEAEETLDDRLYKLTHDSKVMLFMKGNPTSPRCGFSRQIVELLNEHKVEFDSFDILEDDEVRQGLKKYSDWPTYPQLYVNGDLVGGLDIVREMAEGGDLSDMLLM